MSIRTACLFLFTFAFAASAAAELTEQQKRTEDARERVRVFERSLLDHMHPRNGEGKLLTKEQRESIREFFAGLDSSEMKIEALGMMTHRFVYVVPKDMVLSLTEPMVDDAEAMVRTHALLVLGYYHPDQLTKYKKTVIALASSDDPEVRGGVALVMASSGHSMFATPLNQLISDPHTRVRTNAIQAWDRWCVANRRLVLLPLTSDPDRSVAVRAMTSIYVGLPQPTDPNDAKRPPSEFHQGVVQMLNDHYRSLTATRQTEFKIVLKRAPIASWFREAVAPEYGVEVPGKRK